jgi:predicted nucleic acid-binding protein
MGMIYLDTSALVKLIFEESESLVLERWLTQDPGEYKVSSELTRVELLRTCRRVDLESLDDASQLLDGLDFLPIDHSVIRRASSITPTELRSLDAIHLASALSLGNEISAFVAYDSRLCDAARNAGLKVVSPN